MKKITDKVSWVGKIDWELKHFHGMRFKGKKAAVFTSFGWGGGVEKRIQQRLEEAGFEIAAEPLKVKWAPDSDAERQCREWGSAL